MLRLSRQTTLEELDTLPGIGPQLARRLHAYLQAADAPQREADLLNVRGIGPKLLARLRPHLRVYGPAASEVAESEALYHELGLR